MAKKRKRKPPSRPPPDRGEPQPRAGRPAGKREAREAARRRREEALRRARRQSTLRRLLIPAAGGAVALGVLFFLTRATAPNPIPEGAKRAAAAAGCSEVDTPADSAEGNLHVDPATPVTYAERPATSGRHYASRVQPAGVYTDPVDEPAVVHSLEHAYVVLYYRAEGDGALPQEIVDRLTSVAEDIGDKVILASYPDLADGQALALAAWNKLQTCPSTVTADQAATIANGFIEAYRDTTNAPEPNAS